MPPKRRPADTGAPKAPRQSKLAKEHDITAAEEAEIREAFGLFAEPMDGEKEGVIPIGDVRRAMIALGIPPKDKAELAEFTSILDPDDDGHASYPTFVAICALKLHGRDATDEAHACEVDEAFSLFVGSDPASSTAAGGAGGAGGAITLAHLKRVAAVLKEDVPDQTLRDMILEANGGAGVARGVRRDEFDRVLARAGVWR